MLLIDKYAYTNKLRNAKPMVKFSFAMGVLILCLLPVPAIVHGLVFLMMSSVIVFVAGIKGKNYFSMLKIPVSFLLLSVIAIIFSVSSDSQVFLHKINIGSSFIGVTQEGLNMSMRLIMRSLACIGCMYFYSLTTPLEQQIIVFKKLKVPKEIIELMILIYRFIFVFIEEAKYMRLAQEMRFGYDGFKNSLNSFSNMIKLLFMRVMKRNEDMQISLENKFFNGEFYV